MNIHFHRLWLATQAQDILWYPLVCKTKWTHVSNHLPAELWPDVFFFVTRLFTGLVLKQFCTSGDQCRWIAGLEIDPTISWGLVNGGYSPPLGWIIVNLSDLEFIMYIYYMAGSVYRSVTRQYAFWLAEQPVRNFPVRTGKFPARGSLRFTLLRGCESSSEEAISAKKIGELPWHTNSCQWI